jgi:signal transduction histidine kinase
MDISQKQPTILVVDDNADNRALAQATLDDEGCRVVLAATGEDALTAFQAERPDCVLLDVRMPGMDGLEACSRIRALPGGADTPIVFLTALRDVDTFDRAIAAGGDDFLTKPVRPNELVARVQAAVKLRRMNAELREHYDLVRHQRDALMRLQLQKERLTAFVVHDLKNPVNSMDLHAQLLLRASELGDSSRESVKHIRTEARSLLRLVLNLLDISKSEEGLLEPKLTRVELEPLVGEVIEAFELRAKSSGVALRHVLEARTVVADPDLLRRIIENLLDNAIRHAPEGSGVALSSTHLDGAVEIHIADAGAGVPEAMREKIFERYVQVESREHPAERASRGLGLAFCKLAVEAHGGSIRVEDAHPGATFCVRLPDDH